MDLMAMYEKLIDRLDQAEQWLDDSKYSTWEEVRKSEPEIYQLKENRILQVASIQKQIHIKQGLRFGGYND